MNHLKSQSEQAHRKSPQQPPPSNSRIQGHDSQERPRHVQRQQHQKSPQPAKRPHDPQSACARIQDQSHPAKTTASDCTSAGHVACETQRGRLDIAPHGALGGFAQATAALVASAPTSSSGVGRLGDGGCSDIGRRGEAVCVEEGIPIAVRVGRGIWNAGSLRGLRWCRSLRSFTRMSRSARSCSRRARDTGEAQLSGRDWWAALDGQARDQSRLSEGDGSTRDRDGAGAAPRSTLRQRHRRARPGAGPGGGCRGGCCARQGRCGLVAGQLPKGRGGRNRGR